MLLAIQKAPEAVATLLSTPGEAAGEELRGLLEALDIRPRAQTLAQGAADEALRALKDLHLRPLWGQRLEQLVQFVVGRAV